MLKPLILSSAPRCQKKVTPLGWCNLMLVVVAIQCLWSLYGFEIVKHFRPRYLLLMGLDIGDTVPIWHLDLVARSLLPQDKHPIFDGSLAFSNT